MYRVRLFFGMVLTGMWLTAGMTARAAAHDEVQNVVQLQLEAFRKNDFNTAYGFAHSGIKRQFTVPQFEQMVRGGFPAMLKPGAAEFAEVRKEGEIAEVQVILTDEKGSRIGFQYLLEKDNGSWRIVGVVPIEIPEVLV